MSALFIIMIVCMMMSGENEVKGSASVSYEAESHVIQLDDTNFETLTNSYTGDGGAWLVQFYAPWCSQCQELASTWDKLARLLHTSDVFEEPELLQTIHNILFSDSSFDATVTTASERRNNGSGKSNEREIRKLMESLPRVHVAAIDASANFITAKRFDIRGFPRIRMLFNRSQYEYTGDRSLFDLLLFSFDFRLRSSASSSSSSSSSSHTEMKAVPPLPNLFAVAYDYIDAVIVDLTVIILRKSETASVIFFVGFVLGLFLSCLICLYLLNSLQQHWKKERLQAMQPNKRSR